MLIFCLLILSFIHNSSSWFACNDKLDVRKEARGFCCEDVDWWSPHGIYVLNWRAGLFESFLYGCKTELRQLCRLKHECYRQKEINYLKHALDGTFDSLYKIDEVKKAAKFKFLVIDKNEHNKYTDKTTSTKLPDAFVDNSIWFMIEGGKAVKKDLNGTSDRLCPVIRGSTYFGCDFIQVRNWTENKPDYLYVCVFDINGRQDCSHEGLWSPPL